MDHRRTQATISGAMLGSPKRRVALSGRRLSMMLKGHEPGTSSIDEGRRMAESYGITIINHRARNMEADNYQQ